MQKLILNDMEDFICPITQCIMTNPYIAIDGYTYEYEAIKQWITDNRTSPITRQRMTIDNIQPNRLVKKIIERLSNNNTSNIVINNKFKKILYFVFPKIIKLLILILSFIADIILLVSLGKINVRNILQHISNKISLLIYNKDFQTILKLIIILSICYKIYEPTLYIINNIIYYINLINHIMFNFYSIINYNTYVFICVLFLLYFIEINIDNFKIFILNQH